VRHLALCPRVRTQAEEDFLLQQARDAAKRRAEMDLELRSSDIVARANERERQLQRRLKVGAGGQSACVPPSILLLLRGHLAHKNPNHTMVGAAAAEAAEGGGRRAIRMRASFHHVSLRGHLTPKIQTKRGARKSQITERQITTGRQSMGRVVGW